MTHYKAYVIGDDGRIEKAHDLVCPDDEAARESARKLVNDKDIELWQIARKVTRFEGKQ